MALENILILCSAIMFSIMVLAGGSQNYPPGVNPQHYQHQQMHQVPVQHMPQQHVPQQHVPQQHIPQQVPVQQQQMHAQVPQMHQQAHMHAQQPVHGQHQGHVPHAHHGGPPQVLNVANIAQEKEHIAEHLSVPIDTSKMSEQELQFHYFKMHDADNNNKLDGCELIKSLIHWHEQGHGQVDANGQKVVQDKLFKDQELVELIDPILALDDANNDGFIDYPEFVKAQQKAAGAAQAGGQHP